MGLKSRSRRSWIYAIWYVNEYPKIGSTVDNTVMFAAGAQWHKLHDGVPLLRCHGPFMELALVELALPIN